jgi:signal transduction histidine kinase
MLEAFRRRLLVKLLAAQLAVIVAGAATLALVALLIGPTLYERHLHDALGTVPPTLEHHLNEAFGESLLLSLAVAVAASTAAAAAIGWLVSSRIVRPVRALATAARLVSSGDYDARIHLAGEDELAALARSFNDMAAALGAAEQRRRRLLSDVAHELRTPLATLDAYTEGLADGVVEPDEQTWQLLRGETARLKRLSEDIALVSRAEEGQLALHLEPISPRTMLEHAAAEASPSYEAKGVTLQLAAGDAPTVDADPERLGQVLTNLLDNALRHTPAGGTVRLSARPDEGSALLCVEDSGEGLEQPDLERIFERFYRADAARSRERGGSGIGLTIARALVEAHDGRVWAESDGRGRGSRFLVRLPPASGVS